MTDQVRQEILFQKRNFPEFHKIIPAPEYFAPNPQAATDRRENIL